MNGYQHVTIALSTINLSLKVRESSHEKEGKVEQGPEVPGVLSL